MVKLRAITPFYIIGFCGAFIYTTLQTDLAAHNYEICKQEQKIEYNNFSLIAADEQEIIKPENPYEGWENWCEPFDYDRTCETSDDCRGIDHPARRSLQCLNPFYAKNNPNYKICAPGYARKAERDWRKERLREIVRQQYFDEVEYCKLDGRPIHKEHWRCQREKKKADKLTNFLLIPYDRETTRRPWKRHRLDADLRANRTAWFKEAGVYGWKAEAAKDGELGGLVRMTDGTPVNEHYSERHRWHFGLGPFGENVALYLRYWDVQAPPEVLCKEVEAVESYLRNARRVVKNLRNGIRCHGERYEDKSPTWEVIHRAASSGKSCPSTEYNKNAKKKSENFRSSARRHEIDPDEIVTLEMLGKPIDSKNQNTRAAELHNILETNWPVEKMRKRH